jgi:large subunit ribosomal protein L17
MRHGMVNRKLGRTTSHRLAMFRNQLASLIQNERIITTLPKAKEIKPLIERLITLGRNDSVHNRRNAASQINSDSAVSKLFDTIGPRFSDRPGGYTRIVKLGPRRGDAAEMAILELIGYELPSGEKAAPAKKAKAKEKEAPAEEKPKKKASTKRAAKKGDEAEPAEEPKPKRSRKKKTEEE